MWAQSSPGMLSQRTRRNSGGGEREWCGLGPSVFATDANRAEQYFLQTPCILSLYTCTLSEKKKRLLRLNTQAYILSILDTMHHKNQCVTLGKTNSRAMQALTIKHHNLRAKCIHHATPCTNWVCSCRAPSVAKATYYEFACKVYMYMFTHTVYKIQS